MTLTGDHYIPNEMHGGLGITIDHEHITVKRLGGMAFFSFDELEEINRVAGIYQQSLSALETK